MNDESKTQEQLIAELAQLREQIAALQARENELKRTEEALHASNAELRARNEELDAFAHTVAHDLRNPLSLIIGYAETLETDYVRLAEEELRTYLHTLGQNVRKMVNMIDELLLLSDVRKTEPPLQPLEMDVIIAEAGLRLADMVEKYQVHIIVQDPSKWPQALGHSTWVEEVWVNYMSNAIQYGGRPPHVELGAEAQPDGMVRFWVRDSGNGITPEDQARLFKPFTRLDQVRARGYGLGLSIVRRIVDRLGGQVGVESAGIPGQGSTFYFTLPSAPERPPSS